MLRYSGVVHNRAFELTRQHRPVSLVVRPSVVLVQHEVLFNESSGVKQVALKLAVWFVKRWDG
jgi:hypothetical protein